MVMFSNTGNYALPLILFAFGQAALSYASVYFVTSAILVYTVGVFIAASSRPGPASALAGVLRVPALYALAAAGITVVFHVTPPLAVMRPVGMLSDAALPMMLLILGMQLKRAVSAEPSLSSWGPPWVDTVRGAGYRHPFVVLLGFPGPAREAAITLASMPAAVMTTVLALDSTSIPVCDQRCVCFNRNQPRNLVALLIGFLKAT